MSIDLKIQNRCDDVINWEQLSFRADKRTIDLPRPIASSASVSLRLNNVVQPKNSYDVVMLASQLDSIPKSYVQLKERCRLFSPIIEIKYVTVRTYCPKCAGRGTLDDVRYGPDKDLIVVADELLLLQTVEKHITTQLRSNPYHTWIGTTLHELTNNKISDIDFIRNRINQDINKAIENLTSLQAQNQKSGQTMSAGELFGRLLSIDVYQDSAEPSTLHALVKFTAQSGRTLEYDQLLELSDLRSRQ